MYKWVLYCLLWCAPAYIIYARQADYPIENLLIKRWSPRSMTGQAISKKELLTLFEAARWAPSSFNSQPWRFIYVTRTSVLWQKFLNLLVDFNKSWAKNAGALVLVLSDKKSVNKRPVHTHSFDTGAAVQNLALQATALGLVAHVIEGFDYNQARKIFAVDNNYTIEVMIAIGRPAAKKHEVPSGRKKVREFAFSERLPK